MKAFFRNLFSKKKPVDTDRDTIPVAKPTAPEQLPVSPESEQQKPLEPPQLVAACAQSVGQMRDHNEDAMFMLTTILAGDTRQVPFGLYIVADGMGGHQHGEVASSVAVRAMAGLVIQKLLIPLLQLKSIAPEQSFQEIMHDGVLEAHRAILKLATGGGTTLTAVLIFGDQMTIAHVGDSRACLISPDKQINTITRDHSLVKRLVELGQITAEEAAIHPQRNVLYRALGQGEPIDPDIISTTLPRGHFLLLCSDGLWGVVTQEETIEIVLSTPTLHSACQRLIDRANLAGGPDNITAILICFPD